MFETLIRPVVTYRCETWTVSKRTEGVHIIKVLQKIDYTVNIQILQIENNGGYITGLTEIRDADASTEQVY